MDNILHLFEGQLSYTEMMTLSVPELNYLIEGRIANNKMRVKMHEKAMAERHKESKVTVVGRNK